MRLLLGWTRMVNGKALNITRQLLVLGDQLASIQRWRLLLRQQLPQTVTLPAHSAGKVIYVRNLSSSYSISCVGAMEGASGAIALAAKTTIQLVSDGTYWYPISKYVP